MALKLRKINLLIAYPYIINDLANFMPFLVEHKDKLRLLIDSGAFTAWKSGSPVQLDEYVNFIKSLPFEPWNYFTLDVIGDSKKSYDNYLTMRDQGLSPIPIFTRGTDLSMIDRYYELSDYLGIGGLVGTPGNRGYVKTVMRHIAGRKVHLLGFTDKNFIKVYRPYSCDSSSVTSAGRYGMIDLFDNRAGAFFRVGRKDFTDRPSSRLTDLVASYGCDIKRLESNESWKGGRAVSMMLSFRSHIRSSFAFADRLGVNYFLAAFAEEFKYNTLAFLDAYHWEINHGPCSSVGRDGFISSPQLRHGDQSIVV